MEKKLKKLAVNVFGLTDEEWQSLFKTEKTDDGEKSVLIDGWEEKLIEKDKERVNRLKNDHKEELKQAKTTMHDEGYSKAKKDERAKFEDEILKDFGVERDKMGGKYGTELVKDLFQLQKGGEKGDPQEIKNHPDYIKLERKLQSEFIPKEEFEKVKGEFDKYKQDVDRNHTLSKVKEDARKIFRGLKPLLSKDPKRATNQEQDFLTKFESFDFQVQEDGNHVIMKDGKRLENDNMNPINFADYVKTKASELFDFAEQDVRGNSGVHTQPSTSQTVADIKDFSDYNDKYQRETDPEKRQKLTEAAMEKGIIEK